MDLETQMGESEEFMEVDDNEGPVIHTGSNSFSVPSFLSKVFNDELGNDGGNHHKLLAIAVHAVFLDSGFVCYNSFVSSMLDGSVFEMSMWYTLPQLMNHLDKGYETYTVVLRFRSKGRIFDVMGSLSSGSGTRSVCGNGEQLVPFLNLIRANCGPVTEAFSTTSTPEVFKLWRTMKDALAFPLLIDLCDEAGLDIALCFIRLPHDIILDIVGRLPGVQVAKLGKVCKELRYLTSNDDLWKQKFVEQFGDEKAYYQGWAAHWKEKFARAFESQKEGRLLHTCLKRKRNSVWRR